MIKEKKTTVEKEQLPEVEQVFKSTSLYDKINLNNFDENEAQSFVSNIERPPFGIDLYCNQCKKNSTFLNSNCVNLPVIAM